jgi:hypothetical protein
VTEEQMKLKWAAEVMAKDSVTMDADDYYHWESMAYGFFLALGAEPDSARRLAYEVET